jgi:hypothetical protein
MCTSSSYSTLTHTEVSVSYTAGLIQSIPAELPRHCYLRSFGARHSKNSNSCDLSGTAVFIMPIFHDHYDGLRKSPSRLDNPNNEESQRPRYTDPASGDALPGRLHSENAMGTMSRSDVVATTLNDGRAAMLSRVELIERIKRGKSPSWPPHQNVSYA